jgi:hypothetical protein
MAYNLNSIYKLQPWNWYKTYPYGFEYRGRKEGTPLKMWLPINPSNINTVTHFATNVVTTLYGVVEEHSEVRYYDITIQGTTGFAPAHYMPEGLPEAQWSSNTVLPKTTTEGGENLSPNPLSGVFTVATPTDSPFAPTGRSAFVYNPAMPIRGFGQQIAGVWNQNDSTKNNLINGSVNYNGVPALKTGYVAFHNLYRLFLTYKKDIAANGPKKHTSLIFLNFKDNVKYDCAPKTFTLTRSAESPMLYNYSITLRAYNLRDINIKDRDVTATYTDKLAALGLDGITGSAFSTMRNTAGAVRTIVGGTLSALPGR